MTVNKKREERPLAMIPYIVHETEMLRAERRVERLFYMTAVLTGVLVGSNLSWLIIWILLNR